MGANSDKIKGKAKQVEGRLTGDRVREVQGTAEEIKGDVKAAVDRAVTRVKAGVTRTKAKIQRGASRARPNSSSRGRGR